MTQITTDYVVIGHDGELYLVALKTDMQRDKRNPPSRIYNRTTGKISDPMPLQTFFKWGNFMAPDKTIDELIKLAEFNPYHDASTGQFATGSGASRVAGKSITRAHPVAQVSKANAGALSEMERQSLFRQGSEDAQSMALAASYGIEKGEHEGLIVRGEKDEVAAIVSYTMDDAARPGKYRHVEYLASFQRGGGTRLIADLCARAANGRAPKGISLVADQNSNAGFYEKLGMKPLRDRRRALDEGEVEYAFTAAQAKSFADRYAKSPLQEAVQSDEEWLADIVDSEPKNGVFVVMPRKESASEFNPYHDAAGRFAPSSSGGASAPTGTTRKRTATPAKSEAPAPAPSSEAVNTIFAKIAELDTEYDYAAKEYDVAHAAVMAHKKPAGGFKSIAEERDFKMKQSSLLEKQGVAIGHTNNWERMAVAVLKQPDPASDANLTIAPEFSATSQIRVGLKNARDIVGTGIIDNYKIAVTKLPKGETRAFCNERAHMSMARLSASDMSSTAAHEYGHAVEQGNKYVREACRKFLADRTAGETAKKLSVLLKDKGYASDEVAKADKFSDPYVGKIYKNGNTEIFSMGLQRLTTDPLRFAREDRGHFEFMVRTIQEAKGQA